MPAPGATERTLRAILQFIVDPRGMRDVQQSTNEIEKQLSELTQKFYKMLQPIQEIATMASQFEALGFEIAEYGGKITTTFETFAKQYVQSMQGTDAISKEWLETTIKLQAAQQEFGVIASESVLPMMKLQAEIVETASDFLTKYPELAEMAFGLGTAVVFASSLSTAVNKGIRLVTDIKTVLLGVQQLAAAKLMKQAADKQMAAAALGMAATEGTRMQRWVGPVGGAAATGGGIRGLIGRGVGRLGGAVGGLGLTGGLAVGASVASIAATGIAIKRFADSVEKHHKAMGDSWDSFFVRTEKSTDSAIGVLNEYRAAQDRASDAYENQNDLIKIFINEQDILHTSAGKVNEALKRSARDFEDYQEAVDKYNISLKEGENKIVAVSRETFNYKRELGAVREELIRGEISLKQYAKVLVEGGNIVEQIMGTYLYAMGEITEQQALEDLLDDWIEYNNQRQQALDEHNKRMGLSYLELTEKLEILADETGEKREQIETTHSLNILDHDLKFATQRENILSNLNIDLVTIETNIAEERQDAMQDFFETTKEAEEDYYESRAEAAAQHDLETQRAEASHQKDMRRMREDSEANQLKAVRARDAIALLEEKRGYEKSRSRAEEDHAIEMARRNQDFARQLIQMEKSFSEQQATRQKAYQAQIAALEKRLAEERARLQKAAEETLEELDESRVKELRGLVDHKEKELTTLETEDTKQEQELRKSHKQRIEDSKKAFQTEITNARTNWRDKLREAGFWNGEELQEYRSFRRASLGTLKSFVAQANIALQGLRVPSFGGRNYQTGGYAGFGLYNLGEEGDEFVMSNRTTKAAEQLLGGRLTQEGILAGLSATGRGANLTQNFTFHGRLSHDEKAEYKEIAYKQALKALGVILEGAT